MTILADVLARALAKYAATKPGRGYIWPKWDGPEETQPTTYGEFAWQYNTPQPHYRGKAENSAWVTRNIVECHGAGGKHPRLPGVPFQWYVHIHRVVEPYLREALRRAVISAPEYTIERIGGYVYRTIRHKKDAPLSPHGQGFAVDIDPDVNKGRDMKRGSVPPAFSPAWYRLWPGSVTPAFVQAFASCGFAWGGDWDEDGNSQDQVWMDLMHWEWIARDKKRSEV